MFDLSKLRQDIIDKKIQLDHIVKYKEELNHIREEFLHLKTTHDVNLTHIRDLIMIYLDYYTYSETGDVLINDVEYDELMNAYLQCGGELITTSDIITSATKWPFVKHEYPGIVGSVKKVYTQDELLSYMDGYRCTEGRYFRIAPKFDGVSSAIKYDNRGNVVMAVTRNNGVEGQDITEVVRRAWNAREVGLEMSTKMETEHLWVKTELCISMKDFDNLVEEKVYKNRRSATSGIVNSPKNLHLAKYITIIPLAYVDPRTDDIEYHPMGCKDIFIHDPGSTKGTLDMMDEIQGMLSSIRDSHYPFRTDGVVIYPLGQEIVPNFDDIMDHAIAFKVNTAEALTQVDYGYVSIGRLGNAVPMIHVFPAEINEICAHDASLGSFDKFAGMDIHEGEQVVIYAGGDVIPLVRLPEIRHYPADAPLLEIKKRCPYCNEKLTRFVNSYRCENPDCSRVNAGKIANFVVKLGAYGISDQTIQDLYDAKLIKDIPDLFELDENAIASLNGYGDGKAGNIVSEIRSIQEKEIPESKLLGSLGMTGIGEKKSRKLLSVMPIKKALKMKKKKAIFELVSADDIGPTTAKTYVSFIHEYDDMIKRLLSCMNIVSDASWKGNVVFTGFRNPDLEEKFNRIGYEVSSNVNRNTRAVIDSSYSHDSTKCNAARAKGIDIVHVSEVQDVLDGLEGRLL